MKKNAVKTENAKDATNAWKPVATGGTSGLKPMLANIPPHTIGIARNIRRNEITPDTDPKLLELAASIRQVGILEPLIVNQPEGFSESAFTLVAGHRRLAAAVHVGLPLVPAVVYDRLNAKQVLEIQITENIHRVDLSPVEEAETYVRMRDELGMAVEDIAARVGRSTRHVYRYISLLNLPKEVIDKIGEDDIPISKALVLATLPNSIASKIINYDDWLLTQSTAKELPDEIKRRYMADLSADIEFDVCRAYTTRDGKTLPPCKDCPHKNQLELFAEHMDENTCPNRDCFDNKRYAADRENRAVKKEWREAAARLPYAGESDADDHNDGDDNGAQISKEERERIDAEYAEMEAKNREECRKQAEKDYAAADYYLTEKEHKGFSPQDLFSCDCEGSNVGYSPENNYDETARNAFDRLLVKYVGKPFDAIRESGTADEVITATLVYYIYDNVSCNSDEIAEWLGCEEYEDKDEEED